ncbi:MAG TPA: KilA-N domain-containing protein [Chthonomonadales bacterium]|nr:KilA-N domain-containing protein [Chthonomonadales bacterium]
MADPVPSRAIIEVYGQSEIAFRGDGWVNATQMAKPFGKRPSDFLKLPTANAFIAALEKDLGASGENLHLATHGGACPGTWMHPDLALEFARWLSPEFSIWCNRTVRRILQGGAPVGVDLAGVSRVLDRIVASHEQIVATQMALLGRLERLEAPVPFQSPKSSSLLPLPPAPTVEAHFAKVLAATIAWPHAQRLVHPVEIARAALDQRLFRDLLTDPSDFHQVSRFCRFFQGRGYMQRWLQLAGGSLVYCEPIAKNRHRRYNITLREGGAA